MKAIISKVKKLYIRKWQFFRNVYLISFTKNNWNSAVLDKTGNFKVYFLINNLYLCKPRY